MKKILKRFRKIAKGFTLIEILVVVAIIAILSGIILLNSADARAKARNSKRKSDLHTIASALESYYADYNGYPIGEGLVATYEDTPSLRLSMFHNFASSTNTRISINGRTGWWLVDLIEKGYISNTPVDPINISGDTATNGIGVRFDIVAGPWRFAPGLSYLYLNDAPYSPTEGACSGYDTTYGHAQKYKLLVATERGDTDLDYMNDGGLFNLKIYADSLKFGKQLYPIRQKVGVFYEVFSPGAQNWPFPPNPENYIYHTTLEDLHTSFVGPQVDWCSF